ncbi:MAG TPA: DUF4136 domain-containing protein [Allosphingosinicella sp.]|nr:DUF4136 domain-containing protein [Allosphingosinicella sp.]
MKAAFPRACALALAATLSACATLTGGPAASPVDVTRLHLNQTIARATVAVEPANPADRNDPGFAVYRAAVSRQLARLGWVIAPASTSAEQVALIDVEQGSREALARRKLVGGPGTTLTYEATPDIVATQLEVSLRRRSDASVFWEGRAQTAARVGSPEAIPANVVEKLAEALFRDFPGESGRTIRLQ